MTYDADAAIEPYTPDESKVIVVSHSVPSFVGGSQTLMLKTTHVEGVYSIEVDVDVVEEEGTILILHDGDGEPIAMFKNWHGWHVLQKQER